MNTRTDKILEQIPDDFMIDDIKQNVLKGYVHYPHGFDVQSVCIPDDYYDHDSDSLEEAKELVIVIDSENKKVYCVTPQELTNVSQSDVIQEYYYNLLLAVDDVPMFIDIPTFELIFREKFNTIYLNECVLNRYQPNYQSKLRTGLFCKGVP